MCTRKCMYNNGRYLRAEFHLLFNSTAPPSPQSNLEVMQLGKMYYGGNAFWQNFLNFLTRNVYSDSLILRSNAIHNARIIEQYYISVGGTTRSRRDFSTELHGNWIKLSYRNIKEYFVAKQSPEKRNEGNGRRFSTLTVL